MKTRNITASCLAVALGLLGTGTAAADTTEAPALSHHAEPGDSTTATVTVTSSDALVGEGVTVLIMNDHADAADPATEDVVFIEQYELDGAGATDFAVQLPTEALEDYDIALNTAAGTDRYLAPLVGAENPDDGSTQEPDDGATSDPDEEPTADPDDDSTTAPDDGASTDPEGDATSAPDEDATAGPADGSSQGPNEGQKSDGSGTASNGDLQTGDGAGDAGDQSSDGFLANTGANITVGIVIALVAIGLGTLLILRRRNAA